MSKLAKIGGTLLGLAALCTFVAALGGPNVFSVLSNLKSTPTSKGKPLEEKEATTKEVKQEETDLVGPEIALDEEAKSEEPKEEVQPQKVTKEEKPKVEPKTPEPVKNTPKKHPPIQATQPSRPIKWREIPSIFWSPRRGRLYDTKEEIAWKQNYVSPFDDNGSGGKKGTGIWCLTPTADPYQVDKPENCPGVR